MVLASTRDPVVDDGIVVDGSVGLGVSGVSGVSTHSMLAVMGGLYLG
jgi:hypothetical protein